jgi:hypothetical protein
MWVTQACLNKIPNEEICSKSVACVPLCIHRETGLLTLNLEKYQEINEEQLLQRRHLETTFAGQTWSKTGLCSFPLVKLFYLTEKY